MNELLPLDKTSSPGNWKVTELAPLLKNLFFLQCSKLACPWAGGFWDANMGF